MNEKLEKCLQEHPEINDFLSSFILLPNSIFERYMSDEKVIYKNLEISSLLLIDIISSIHFKEKTNKSQI